MLDRVVFVMNLPNGHQKLSEQDPLVKTGYPNVVLVPIEDRNKVWWSMVALELSSLPQKFVQIHHIIILTSNGHQKLSEQDPLVKTGYPNIVLIPIEDWDEIICEETVL